MNHHKIENHGEHFVWQRSESACLLYILKDLAFALDFGRDCIKATGQGLQPGYCVLCPIPEIAVVVKVVIGV